VTVKLNITHTYDSDLIIQLVSPSGRVVTLSNRRGGSGDNYTNTVFDSTASIPIRNGSAPFAGTYAPDGSLTIFHSKDAKGTWELEVSDVAYLDQGTLNSWSLTIQGTAGSGAPPAVIVGSGTTGTKTPAAPTLAWLPPAANLPVFVAPAA